MMTDPGSPVLVPSGSPKRTLPGSRVGSRVHKLVSEKIAKNIPGTDSFYQFSLYPPLSKVSDDGPQDYGIWITGVPTPGCIDDTSGNQDPAIHPQPRAITSAKVVHRAYVWLPWLMSVAYVRGLRVASIASTRQWSSRVVCDLRSELTKSNFIVHQPSS